MVREIGIRSLSSAGLMIDGGGGSAATADEREPEKELYLRSLPRPDSGVGPASVSSQSLWRKPMSFFFPMNTMFDSFVTTEIR